MTRTLKREFDVPEDMEPMEPSRITVYDKTDGGIPDHLQETVETALIDRIGHLMDGKDVTWFITEDGHYALSVLGGFPEMPPSELGGPWLPPYRTREVFEGLTDEYDHLSEILKYGYRYELKNESELVFFRD